MSELLQKVDGAAMRADTSPMGDDAVALLNRILDLMTNSGAGPEECCAIGLKSAAIMIAFNYRADAREWIAGIEDYLLAEIEEVRRLNPQMEAARKATMS